MTYANQTDVQWLWEQIDAFFARLNEAGGSLLFDGDSITLMSVDGTQNLGEANIHAYYPKKNEAGGSLTFNNNVLQLYAVDGTALGGGIDIGQAISSATSGFSTIQNTGRSLNIPNGTRRLELWNASGDVISYVNLP